MTELNRKIWEGGLMATGCVNSPGLRRLVSIHLGFLCHLQAFCMHAAEPRVWKTGLTSPRLCCLLGEERVLPLAELPCVRTAALSFLTCWPTDPACGSSTLTTCYQSTFSICFTCLEAHKLSSTARTHFYEYHWLFQILQCILISQTVISGPSQNHACF